MSRIHILARVLVLVGATLAATLTTAHVEARDRHSDDPSVLESVISAGGPHSCAIKADGTVVCWGRSAEGQATPPAGTFTQVSLGGFLHDACALRADHTAACWSTLTRVDVPPKDAFVQLSSGRHFACGTRMDGTFACWGDVPFAL